MRVLVTGGAGFMGSDFIRYLLQRTDFQGRVVNIDLLTYAGNLSLLRDVEGDPRYSFILGDICDGDFLHKVGQEEFDWIVHFAAETHVDRSIDAPKTFIETNVMGTYSILELVRANPHIKMHLISTDEVYGDLPSTGVFTETSRYRPSSPYAASKAAAGQLTLSYTRTYGIYSTVSLASNNFGPGQNREKFIPKIITKCLQEEALPIYGKGENVRDWLYVRDHSRAIYEIMQRGKSGEVYNVGGESEKSNLEVVHLIIKKIAEMKNINPKRLESLIEFVPDRPGHDFRYALDVTKIKQQIGWRKEVNFEEGLYQTIESFMEKEV